MAEILNQEEVDLLLSAVTAGEVVDIEKAPAEVAPGAVVKMTAYDFRRPERVSKEQLKGLQSLFEAFGRELSILFPPYLRTVVRFDLISIDQLTYDEFILSVSRPTSLSIIDMSPLEGNAVLELSPTLIFPIIDRVLGGRGLMLGSGRELTEIENRIILRIVQMILQGLRRSWEQLIEFELSVIQQENDPLIVQIVAGGEMVVLVGYEVHIGENTGYMNLCIPLMVLTPVLNQISEQAHFTRPVPPEMQEIVRAAILKIVAKAEVPVDATLGYAELTMEELLELQEGDVIQLNTSPEDPVSVFVGGHRRFFAVPGRRGEQSAIQLIGFADD